MPSVLLSSLKNQRGNRDTYFDAASSAYKDLKGKVPGDTEEKWITSVNIGGSSLDIDLLNKENVRWIIDYFMSQPNAVNDRASQEWKEIFLAQIIFYKTLFNTPPSAFAKLLDEEASPNATFFNSLFDQVENRKYHLNLFHVEATSQKNKESKKTRLDNKLMLAKTLPPREYQAFLTATLEDYLVNTLKIPHSQVTPFIPALIEYWQKNNLSYSEFRDNLLTFLVYEKPMLLLNSDDLTRDKGQQAQFESILRKLRTHFTQQHTNIITNLNALNQKKQNKLKEHFKFNLAYSTSQTEYALGTNPTIISSVDSKSGQPTFKIVGANQVGDENVSQGAKDLKLDVDFQKFPELKKKIEAAAKQNSNTTILLNDEERNHIVDQCLHQPELFILGDIYKQTRLMLDYVLEIKSGKVLSKQDKLSRVIFILSVMGEAKATGEKGKNDAGYMATFPDPVIDNLIADGDFSNHLSSYIAKLQKGEAARILNKKQEAIDWLIQKLKEREKLKATPHPYLKGGSVDLSSDLQVQQQQQQQLMMEGAVPDEKHPDLDEGDIERNPSRAIYGQSPPYLISKAANKELEKYQSQLQGMGIQYDNLPNGFYLKTCQVKDTKKTVLLYDAKHSNLLSRNSLTQVLSTLSSAAEEKKTLLTPELGSMDQFVGYRGQEKKLIQDYVGEKKSDMATFMKLEDPKFSEGYFRNKEKNKFIQSLTTSGVPNDVLLFLVCRHGARGSAVLMDHLNNIYQQDKDLFNILNKQLLQHYDASMLESLDIILNVKTIAEMQSPKKEWFSTLIKQHDFTQSPASLKELLESFHYFCDQYTTMVNQELPVPCGLKNISQLQVGLDRYLKTAIRGKAMTSLTIDEFNAFKSRELDASSKKSESVSVGLERKTLAKERKEQASSLPIAETKAFVPPKDDATMKEHFANPKEKSILHGMSYLAKDKTGKKGQLFQHHMMQLETHLKAINDKGKDLRQIADKDLYQQAKDLLDEVKKRKGGDKEDAKKDNSSFIEAQVALAACLREIMYRTDPKHRFANATQMLSLINEMVFNKGNSFAQIDTGQGKSLITAMMAAMLYAEGGTVEVCTSDAMLAKEGHDEFNPFFEALGIRTGRTPILADSALEEFAEAGIYYSDIANLALFKAKQQVDSKPLPSGQAPRIFSAIIDEVDFVANLKTTFRYAASITDTPSERDLKSSPSSFTTHNPEWYEVINNFIDNDQKFKDGRTKEDIKKAFHDFCGKNAPHLSDSVPDDDQLDTWLNAAVTAKRCAEAEKFNIRTVEKAGVSYSAARHIINNVESAAVELKEGGQQFLHARLNKKYKDKIDALQMPEFEIAAEKRVINMLLAKNVLDSYAQSGGRLKGLTGTMGDQAERAALHQQFSARLTYYPPYQDKRRLDLTQLVETNEDVFNVIMKQLFTRLSKENPQPILLLCENAQAAAKLHQRIQQKLNEANANAKNKRLAPFDVSKMQLYTAKTSDNTKEQENEVLKNAVLSGAITISDSLGRGKDFKPTHDEGLFVIANYLGDKNTIDQGRGRAGRQGQEGQSLHLISKEMLGFTPKQVIDRGVSSREVIKRSRKKAFLLTKQLNALNQKFNDINAYCLQQLIAQSASQSDLARFLRKFEKECLEYTTLHHPMVNETEFERLLEVNTENMIKKAIACVGSSYTVTTEAITAGITPPPVSAPLSDERSQQAPYEDLIKQVKETLSAFGVVQQARSDTPVRKDKASQRIAAKEAEWQTAFTNAKQQLTSLKTSNQLRDYLHDLRQASLDRESVILHTRDGKLGKVRLFLPAAMPAEDLKNTGKSDRVSENSYKKGESKSEAHQDVKAATEVVVDKYDIFANGLDYARAVLEILKCQSADHSPHIDHLKKALMIFQQHIAENGSAQSPLEKALKAKSALKRFNAAMCSLIVQAGCCNDMKSAKVSLNFVRDFLWKKARQSESFCSVTPSANEGGVMTMRIIKPLAVQRDGASPWENPHRNQSEWYKDLKMACGNGRWLDSFADSHLDALSRLAPASLPHNTPGPANAYDSTLIVMDEASPQAAQVLQSTSAALTEPFGIRDTKEKAQFTREAHQSLVLGKNIRRLQALAEQQINRWGALQEKDKPLVIPILHQTLVDLTRKSPGTGESRFSLADKAAANKELQDRLDKYSYYYDRAKNTLLEVPKNASHSFVYEKDIVPVVFKVLETHRVLGKRSSGWLSSSKDNSNPLISVVAAHFESIKGQLEDEAIKKSLETIIAFLNTKEGYFREDKRVNEVNKALKVLADELKKNSSLPGDNTLSAQQANDIVLLAQSAVELYYVTSLRTHFWERRRQGLQEAIHKATNEQIIAELLGQRFGGDIGTHEQREIIERQKQAYLRGFYSEGHILRWHDDSDAQINFLKKFGRSAPENYILNKMATGIALSKETDLPGTRITNSTATEQKAEASLQRLGSLREGAFARRRIKLGNKSVTTHKLQKAGYIARYLAKFESLAEKASKTPSIPPSEMVKTTDVSSETIRILDPSVSRSLETPLSQNASSIVAFRGEVKYPLKDEENTFETAQLDKVASSSAVVSRDLTEQDEYKDEKPKSPDAGFEIPLATTIAHSDAGSLPSSLEDAKIHLQDPSGEFSEEKKPELLSITSNEVKAASPASPLSTSLASSAIDSEDVSLKKSEAEKEPVLIPASPTLLGAPRAESTVQSNRENPHPLSDFEEEPLHEKPSSAHAPKKVEETSFSTYVLTVKRIKVAAPHAPSVDKLDIRSDKADLIKITNGEQYVDNVFKNGEQKPLGTFSEGRDNHFYYIKSETKPSSGFQSIKAGHWLDRIRGINNKIPNEDTLLFAQAQLIALQKAFESRKTPLVVEIRTKDEYLFQAYVLICKSKGLAYTNKTANPKLTFEPSEKQIQVVKDLLHLKDIPKKMSSLTVMKRFGFSPEKNQKELETTLVKITRNLDQVQKLKQERLSEPQREGCSRRLEQDATVLNNLLNHHFFASDPMEKKAREVLERIKEEQKSIHLPESLNQMEEKTVSPHRR